MGAERAPSYWQELAYECARDANENHLSTHRGIWAFEDEAVLCLYNNTPYADYPTLRDEERAEFRRWLEAEGIRELAYATYPEGGERAGHTYAMLLDVGERARSKITDKWRKILEKSFERIGSSIS